MIPCIAIDDEPLALKQLSGYIEKTPFLKLVASCTNALQAIERMREEKTDLIFVDINMPDLSGMEFVKSLAVKPMIIFTTAYSEYALEGFRVDALDYLLKPIGYPDFLKSATKALRQQELMQQKAGDYMENDRLFIRSEGKMIQLIPDDILYIESQSEYIRIFTDQGKAIMALLSMKLMEERLPSDKFMRIHRSYIVNLNKISAVAKGRIIIDRETYLPIGDQYKNSFYSFLEKHSLS